ncbi:MAG TPA: hypothetical protein VFI90_13250 [Rubrobacter sp.]|nr:hypothetical protein [Rubrobacter sp.]
MTEGQNQGQQPAAMPPQPPPPGSGGGWRTGLYVGGCAVAAVLGLLTLLAVGALLFFLLSRPATPEPAPQPVQPETSQPETSQPETPRPETTQPAPQPQPEPQPQPSPDSGSLDDLVQQQVGNFTLQKIEKIPEAISAGATDARTMIYASADGLQIGHDLTAWTSPDLADQQIQAVGDALTSKGFQRAKEFQVTDDQGQQIGTGAAYTGEIQGTTIEVILWSNGVLFCSIFAPEGYGVDFYNSLGY